MACSDRVESASAASSATFRGAKHGVFEGVRRWEVGSGRWEGDTQGPVPSHRHGRDVIRRDTQLGLSHSLLPGASTQTRHRLSPTWWR
jgi:hypothetical protein